MVASVTPRVAALLGALSLLVGCGPSKEATADTEDGGSTDDTTGTPQPTTAGMSTAAADSTGSDATAGMDADTNGDALDTGMEDGSFIDSADSAGDSPMPGGLGEMCDGNDGCESGFCYQVPMVGGVCSECLMDSDCEMGTCAGDFQAGYAVCTDGSAGSMCDSDEGCMGDLVCAQVLEGMGFPLNFCSECDTDVPCEGGDICTPQLDAMNLSGQLVCAAPGSVADGGGCPLDAGVGDGTVCTSGLCGVADVFGFLEIGVCGECVVDTDCPMMGQTCSGPSAGMGGIQPAVCQ